ncbi:MAG: hypothetical protein AAGJ28_00865 [Pseudomonadota bacterium]
MSDPKDPQNPDPKDKIVARPEGEPEVLGDSDLDEVDGGMPKPGIHPKWSFTSTNTSTFDVSIGNDTINASGTEDVIGKEDINMLRVRPGRFGNPFGG